jgi:hypothetical protein
MLRIKSTIYLTGQVNPNDQSAPGGPNKNRLDGFAQWVHHQPIRVLESNRQGCGRVLVIEYWEL